MKYNMVTKTVAVLLAVLCGAFAIMSGIVVFVNLNYGYYSVSPVERQEQTLLRHGEEYTEMLAEKHAFTQSGLPRELWEHCFGRGYLSYDIWPEVDYRITVVDQSGNATVEDYTTLADYYHIETIDTEGWTGYAVKVGEDWGLYPEYLGGEGYVTDPTELTLPLETTPPETTVSDNAVPTESPNDVAEVTTPPGFESDYNLFTDDEGDMYRVYRSESPVLYTVELFYTQEQYEQVVSSWGGGAASPLGEWMYSVRHDAMGIFVGTVLLLVLLMTYLAFAAGRKPGCDGVRPAGLNRLPLDLYTALDLFGGFFLVWALFEPVMGSLFELDQLWNEPFWLLAAAAVGLSLAIALVCVLYWCALCAQVKADGFWWKKSILGRFGDGIWNFTKRVLRKLWNFLSAIFRKCWSAVLGVGGRVGENVPTFTEWLRDFNNKLPLMWQWLAASMIMIVFLAFFGSLSHYGIGMFFYLVVAGFCIVGVLYGARAFGQLRDAAKRMSQGNLDVKINPDTLEGCFRDFARDLNALSDACITAAREQLKSERMKTELITNVSHDIKTPLTSIINYVDLLKKAKTEQERQEYLEVLDRQSARLKKLIEDLMEMSKASTGNVAVDLQPTDVVESVNQALGEYADRFDKLGLNVVFRKSGESVTALCDGKLLWRVLSNVLSNVVKYAMPNTRVYLDLTGSEFKVQLALKNISREELNISAEELMERFVRGDESRNTEGNGLGLNIAKSLMEVQNGSLDLVVDGDLFKVVLTLPRAESMEIAEV